MVKNVFKLYRKKDIFAMRAKQCPKNKAQTAKFKTEIVNSGLTPKLFSGKLVQAAALGPGCSGPFSGRSKHLLPPVNGGNNDDR
jgi:hypothetical protein